MTSKKFVLTLALAVVASVVLAATPAAADPHRVSVVNVPPRLARQTSNVCDDGLERAVKALAEVLILELAMYGPAFQPQMMGGGPVAMGPPHYDYRPPTAYGQPGPLVIYEQPQYQEGLGPVILMPRQNTMGYFRQVSPNYYTIDRSPPLRLPPGARVLRPWVEGRTGVTLHLPGSR